MRLGRWQQVLLDALAAQPAIGVRATVEAHLKRLPSRTELIAARRAAHRLGDRARVVHVEGVASHAGHLVLVRPGVQLDSTALKRAAEGRPPTPFSDRIHGTGTAKSALRWAQRAADAARHVDSDRVSLDQADALSIELDDAIEHLSRLSRQLRTRASSDAWIKSTDRLWQQRWADVLTHHQQTGEWPVSRSTDPQVRSLGRWIDYQRKQHKNRGLPTDREITLRAAGVRLTSYRRSRASTDESSEEGADSDPS